jgi:glycerol-3-phosphate dehydrogenase
MLPRHQALEASRDATFDVIIVGAGISGAAVFRELSQRGYRVLLLDQGDFSGGTSQASGMLIWGGLLYLKNLDLRTVVKLSRARDHLLKRRPNEVQRLRFRYLPLRGKGRSRWLVSAALCAYWLLGGLRRQRPFGEGQFPSSNLLRSGRFLSSLVYEEAALSSSDSRFALGRVLEGGGVDQVALNHCALHRGLWRRSEGRWELDLKDQVSGERLQVRSRFLINAGGVWADQINGLCGLESEYRHVFSKGVYLGLKKPEQLDEALVFEMGEHGDSQTFTPWGPLALWGPTETPLENLKEGFAPTVQDVRFLLDQATRNLRKPRTARDVVSLRCGVRPLAVKRGFQGKHYPLELSRRHVVARDSKAPAVTLFGGKLTSASMMARETAQVLEGYLLPTSKRGRSEHAKQNLQAPLSLTFPGLDEPLADPTWCVEHEGCIHLDDYMRRRTNLSQWVPRLGLGADGEHEPFILKIANAIHSAQGSGPQVAHRAVADLEKLRQAAAQQDQLLGAV